MPFFFSFFAFSPLKTIIYTCLLLCTCFTFAMMFFKWEDQGSFPSWVELQKEWEVLCRCYCIHLLNYFSWFVWYFCVSYCLRVLLNTMLLRIKDCFVQFSVTGVEAAMCHTTNSSTVFADLCHFEFMASSVEICFACFLMSFEFSLFFYVNFFLRSRLKCASPFITTKDLLNNPGQLISFS